MTSQGKRNLILAMAAFLLAAMACSLPLPGRPGNQESAESTEPVPSSQETLADANALPVRAERKEVEVEDISAVVEDISGPVLLLQVTNLTDDEVLVTLPCGFILQPADEDEQRLMVIQPEEVRLPPGGEGELEPYVICIDGNKAGPSIGSSYSLGVMASGDLLTLARCLCNEDLTALEEAMEFDSLIGLQFAVWMASEGVSDLGSLMEAMGEDSGGVFGDMVGEELGELGVDMEQFMGLIDQFMGQPAREWLEKCGLGEGES
jgi:hypothetical protein